MLPGHRVHTSSKTSAPLNMVSLAFLAGLPTGKRKITFHWVEFHETFTLNQGHFQSMERDNECSVLQRHSRSEQNLAPAKTILQHLFYRIYSRWLFFLIG